LWAEINRIFELYQVTPFARELEAAFESIPDAKIIGALENKHWTGRKGYPVRAMWRAAIGMRLLSQPVFYRFQREQLGDGNPFLSQLCGFVNGDRPTRSAFSRFWDRLLDVEPLIIDCSARMVDSLIEKVPEFGKLVAVDGTKIYAWTNQYKRASDSDAQLGVKGKQRKHIWFGYLAHVVSCATWAIPISVLVTPANVHESPFMLPLLRMAKDKIWGFAPKVILADGAYDTNENYEAIVEEFKSIPIIALNPRGTRKTPITAITKLIPELIDFRCDNEGIPYCKAGVPLVFWGYDKGQKILKYRCPLVCGKEGCLTPETCSASSYGYVVKLKLKDDYRRFIQVPRHTDAFKKLYNKRVNAEHTFAMSKGFRALERPRVRGLANVRIHCELCVIAMQAWALAMVKLGQPERIRSCVHGLAI
jgi:hypothetical protein